MTTTSPISHLRMSRRRFAGSALAVAAAAPFGVTGRATAAPVPPGPVQLTLPAPTGPHRVGTVQLRLVDRSRRRELMASVWYPARNVTRYPRASWMPPAAMRALLMSADFPADSALAPLTAGHLGAPVRRPALRAPVVVFSHGAHDHRASTTIVVQELASHGYVVVTVDHTGDAFSEFPDGRLTVPLDDPDTALVPADFAEDIRFVLRCVEGLAHGHNPDAGHRTLPTGLAHAIDLDRIGMFGWSKGGTATALVMIEERRVRAGLSLDGPMQPIITAGLDRPFMLMTAEFTRAAEPSVAEFWSHLHGWRLNVQADGGLHNAYGDYPVLIPQLASAIGIGDEELRQLVGTLGPDRAARIQQAYPLAFFDLHLRRRGRLLRGPSTAFPEVEFRP